MSTGLSRLASSSLLTSASPNPRMFPPLEAPPPPSSWPGEAGTWPEAALPVKLSGELSTRWKARILSLNIYNKLILTINYCH